MTIPPNNKMAVAYLKAVINALDDTSATFGPRGDMDAALAALSCAQAQLIAEIPEGRMRKRLRKICDDRLLEYLTAAVREDKRGVHKPSMAVLPPKVN